MIQCVTCGEFKSEDSYYRSWVRGMVRDKRCIECEKVAMTARKLVAKAKKVGALPSSMACEMCGSNQFVQAHHGDYLRPLDVVFLCSSCHCTVHRRAGILPVSSGQYLLFFGNTI